MTLQEAQKKVAELKKALLEAEKELEALQHEATMFLPDGFSIVSRFSSGSYDRYLELKYHGLVVANSSVYKEQELASKAREFAEFYEKVKSI